MKRTARRRSRHRSTKGSPAYACQQGRCGSRYTPSREAKGNPSSGSLCATLLQIRYERRPVNCLREIVNLVSRDPDRD